MIVQKELAEVRSSSSPGKSDKNEYYLTSKGIQTLKNWLVQPIQQLPIKRNEILLKLFFGRYQEQNNQIQLLQKFKQDLEARYQTHLTIEQAIIKPENTNEDSIYWLFTLDYGKRTTTAAIDWCEFTINKITMG